MRYIESEEFVQDVEANLREVYNERIDDYNSATHNNTVMTYAQFRDKALRHLLAQSSDGDIFYDILDDFKAEEDDAYDVGEEDDD